MLLNRF